MEHKGLAFNKLGDFIDQKSRDRVGKAWDKSLAHQIPEQEAKTKTSVIQAVVERIQAHLA